MADFQAEMSAEFEARDGGTSEDDIKAYAETAGAVGGAAACAALGAPAAAPLCATIGGWIGGAVAGALLSVFGDADEAAERAKQYGRAAKWAEYRHAIEAYLEAVDRLVYDALTEFVRKHWADLEGAEIPGVQTPWGPATFGGLLAGAGGKPNVGAFEYDIGRGFLNPSNQLSEYYSWLDAAVPGVRERRNQAGGYFADLPGSPGCPGTYGDSTNAAHAKCRERIETKLRYLDQDVKAAVIITLGEWATVAAANRATRTSGEAPADKSARAATSSKLIPVLVVGGGALLLALRR